MVAFHFYQQDFSDLELGARLYSKQLDINAEIIERRNMAGCLHYRLKFSKNTIIYEKIISPAGLHISGFTLLKMQK